MQLWQEIGAQLGEGAEERSVTALRFMVTAGQGGYFQNIRGVFSFSGKEVVLLCGKEKVVVEGENLTIRKYCEKDILIGGNVRGIRREDGNG